MRLPWLHRSRFLYVHTHSLLHGRSVWTVLQDSQRHESSSGGRVLQPQGILINAISILDTVRVVPSAVESVLVKSG